MNVADVSSQSTAGALPPKTGALREAVDRDGYVVVPGVLSAREVGALRTAVANFCSNDVGTAYVNEAKTNKNVFASEPDEMVALVGHPGIARAMREIAGPDVVFMRELGVGIGGSSGWHKDTHSLKRSVRGEHEGYGVYKILIYPQDHLGLAPDDFALRVRKASHWIPDAHEGEIETLHVRAGDLIIIDCRTSHRGRRFTTDGSNILARALYYPLHRRTPGLVYDARRRLQRTFGRQERQLVTLLYGTPGHFTDEYMRQGRELLKKLYPELDVNPPLPASWKRALDSVNIAY